nr:FRIGIDA-like protein 3 [Quercus suber]XP_023921756.1 FRIGIDA-like protein 3 [Quercus suber]XP_023921757.1 FRIGIDA-like protein 3 [Quercus suber]XP_023921758.1 FRIGIDA-like protein 3 [Quercus suber]XP_023921759.1 FRIGIDA-like protein 3 [Quercus suber]POE98797.1 frigida-like protein 3 [Quercus suber]
MTDVEQAGATDTTSSLIEQLGNAFLDLHARKDAFEDEVQWTEVEEHFRNLELLLKEKFEQLEAKEKEFEEKETETRLLIAEREAAVAAKEQDLLDRVQELKESAVTAIAEARSVHQPTSVEAVDDGDNKDGKVSSSLGDMNSPEEDSSHKTTENAEGVAVVVKPRPELMQLCQQMDSKGLLSYTMENKKHLSAIREQLSVALESATEPARLVLDSLEGFYPPDETTQPMDKKDAALPGMRKSCVMFMEAMTALLARVDPGGDHLLNPKTKQQAKAIADEWNPKLANSGIDAANGNSLEAEAFLQLLATFRIASEFDEDELCKFVLAVAHRRQAPELCRTLGLTHKMPGIVESLINSGKQINAVRFIHAFELTESFPTVPLLKSYLKDLRRNSQGKGGNSEGVGGSQNEVNAQELAALKAVIRCIEEFKLEADYPLDPLQRRVAQLEKSKTDKKRGGDFGRRQQSKKPRANGGFRGFRAPVASAASAGRQGPPAFVERAAYTGMSERYPHAGMATYDYQVPSQPAFVQQANDQRLYYYPQDDRVTPTSYNAASTNYGGYIGGGLQSSHQPYM